MAELLLTLGADATAQNNVRRILRPGGRAHEQGLTACSLTGSELFRAVGSLGSCEEARASCVSETKLSCWWWGLQDFKTPAGLAERGSALRRRLDEALQQQLAQQQDAAAAAVAQDPPAAAAEAAAAGAESS